MVCLILFFFIGQELLKNSDSPLGPDFVQYWSAGKLNLSGDNPYNPALLFPIQNQTGVIEDQPIIMWNPPWIMPIAMLFGVVNFEFSRLLWFLINFVVIFISVNQFWNLYGGNPQLRWISWLLGFTFIPVLSSLKIGQISACLLLGIVGFLHFNEKKKYWSAGFFLSLLMVKPQILYLVLLAVFLWSISKKEWRVILGTLMVLAGATATAMLFNPDIIQEYIYAIQNFPPIEWATPTLGGLLRILFGHEHRWLQFIPPLLGVIWLILYWMRNKSSWQWMDQAPLLILVSALTAAYSWTWDLVVLIVPVLQVTISLIPLWRERYSLFILLGYLLIEIIAFFRSSNQFWTFWFAPALLVLYMVSQYLINHMSASSQQPLTRTE